MLAYHLRNYLKCSFNYAFLIVLLNLNSLSYNWHFDVNKSDSAEAAKLFCVPDFIGDACKAIASRVRGAVASVPFDDFHKNSASIIRASVFGLDENKKIRKRFAFPQNNLVVTSIGKQFYLCRNLNLINFIKHLLKFKI